MRAAIILIFLMLLSPLAMAQTFPRAVGFVNDFAGVIDPVTEAQLKAIVDAVEQNTTAEIVIVTVNSTAPLTPQQYRTELFDKWNIGKADKDNGLLILFVVQENRIEVEVGYGLEGILNDAKVGRILDEHAVPYKTSGNYSEMLLHTTIALGNVIMENADEVRSSQTSRDDGFGLTFYVFWFLLIFIGPVIVSKFYKEKCPKCGKRKTSEIRRETIYEHRKGLFGMEKDRYVVVTYRCGNCGHEFKKKRREQSHSSFVVIGGGFGGHSGGGFGGFGGGGSGGGGAGR